MRNFILQRTEDVTGISGTGDIAEGVVFHDGQVVISWFGRYHAFNIYPDIATAITIHGHQGRTRMVFQDGEVISDG